MSKRYQVLARKYRPQSFNEVVGQLAAVTTLKNALRFDKIAHAYLFCGSRGVGKTTLARLFAKALNCQSPAADFEPCNRCPSCLEILSGQSLDVMEIDGASNRGIDDIRQINETVGYAPSHGRYKIYIIDEVHMLTKEAFNALLKTLEEPPERAKFFFATTEPHKVLPTIISRCQRFDLARIQNNLIVSKLQQIADDLQRNVETEALELIAGFAEGSLRDAESLFDQILCFSEETITAAIVRGSLGLVPAELFYSLDEAFSSCNLAYAFELVDQLFQTGKDLAHFLEQLIEHYRNLTLAKLQNQTSAKHYTQQQCLHILDLLIQAEGTFQKSPCPRIALESIVLQIIRSKNRIPIEVLVRHVVNAKENLPDLPLEPQSNVPEQLPPKIEPVAEVKGRPVPEAPPAPVVVKPELQVEPVQEVKPALEAEAALKSEPVQEALPVPQTEPISIVEPAPEKTAAPKEKPVPAPALEPVPFSPYSAKPEEPKNKPLPATENLKHPSHYDTLMRFAAIELEGTVKN